MSVKPSTAYYKLTGNLEHEFKIDSFKYSCSWVTYFIFANGIRLKWHDDKESQLFNYVSPLILSLHSSIISLHWHTGSGSTDESRLHLPVVISCAFAAAARAWEGCCHWDWRAWLRSGNAALFQHARSCLGTSRSSSSSSSLNPKQVTNVFP